MVDLQFSVGDDIDGDGVYCARPFLSVFFAVVICVFADARRCVCSLLSDPSLPRCVIAVCVCVCL